MVTAGWAWLTGSFSDSAEEIVVVGGSVVVSLESGVQTTSLFKQMQ